LEEDDGRLYNYDDGISALSAHTLEDMAERELFLDRLRGIPIEEGFDIIEDRAAVADVSQNIESSSMAYSMEDSAVISLDIEAENMAARALVPCSPEEQEDQYSKEECQGVRRASYPVQMARNRSAVTNTSASSKQSSKSDFTDVWKRQEQQCWMQIVEENGPAELLVASEAAKVCLFRYSLLHVLVGGTPYIYILSGTFLTL